MKKDVEKGFYKTGSLTCKPCTSADITAKRKEKLDKTHGYLMELQKSQSEMLLEMESMKKEIKKLRKAIID